MLTLKLFEEQRAIAIALSGTQGGDGVPLILDVNPNAVRDLATNPNLGDSLVINETADSVLPVPLNASIDYDSGIVKIQFSEIIDLTPDSSVVTSKIRISNTPGETSADSRIDLSGGQVVEIDSTVLTLTFSEAQRALAIALSGTSGGDGGKVVLDIFENAIVDIAQNTLETTLGVLTEESADVTPPNVTNVRLFLSDGRIEITADETLDLTTVSEKVDLQQVYFSNAEGDQYLHIFQPQAVVEQDALIVTITLTEAQRVKAIEGSATPGGDGVGLLADFFQGAFKDIAQNPSNAKSGLAIIEFLDSVRPHIVAARVNYTDGVLIIQASETIDTTPASFVNLTHVFSQMPRD